MSETSTIFFFLFNLGCANMKKMCFVIPANRICQSHMHNSCQTTFLSGFICGYLGYLMIMCDYVFIFLETAYLAERF